MVGIGTGVGGNFIPPHGPDGANHQALAISRYHERIAGRPRDDLQVAAFHAMLLADSRAIVVEYTCTVTWSS